MEKQNEIARQYKINAMNDQEGWKTVRLYRPTRDEAVNTAFFLRECGYTEVVIIAPKAI